MIMGEWSQTCENWAGSDRHMWSSRFPNWHKDSQWRRNPLQRGSCCWVSRVMKVCGRCADCISLQLSR